MNRLRFEASRVVVLEFGEDVRVTDIDPAALDAEAGKAMAGVDHGADGVGEFVFAAR